MPPLTSNTLPSQLPTGYAASKAVAEHLLAEICRASGGSITILRVGQLAGCSDMLSPTWGTELIDHLQWSSNGWFYALLRTSKSLGKIPEDLPVVIDWLPIDVAATSILEIIHEHHLEDKRGNAVKVMHVVNPQRRSWKHILAYFQGSLHCVKVSLEDWLTLLNEQAMRLHVDDMVNGRVSDETIQALHKNYPAIALQNFFLSIALFQKNKRGPSVYLTEEAARYSRTLAECKAISQDDVARWMKEWEL